MAAKKINWRLAQTIAHKIAEKAFEHLETPLEKALESIADEAYSRLLPMFEQLEQFSVVDDSNSYCMKLMRDDVANEDSAIELTKLGHDIKIVRFNWTSPTVRDSALYARAEPIATRLRELGSQKYRLKEELREQLDGKTTKFAMTNWPEAADIIAEAAGVQNGTPMTTPLEVLLAKFLPMLPAPQPEGV